MQRGVQRSIQVAFFCVLLLSSGCSNTSKSAKENQPKSSSSSAVRSGPVLPTAPLGVFVSHFLGRDGQPSTKAATAGVDAQVQLHRKFNPLTNDDTFALLTQFGTILQINIPDMLNRSTDRPKTLTQYTDSLKNITIRATRTAADLTNHQNTLREDEKKQQTQISELTRQLNVAKRNGDLGTLSTVQRDVAEAQGKLGQIRTQEQQTKDLLSYYQNLIDISTKRQAAIEQNREVLIAGLKVSNIPGVENLGVLQGSKSSRPSGTFLQGL